MRTKLILATLFLTFIGIAAQAQEPQPSEPKGKAIVQVFANFHTGFVPRTTTEVSSWIAAIWAMNISSRRDSR